MEKERLKFCIERFDHYFDSVNNKSAVFLALGTFIVGGMIAGYGPLHDIANCGIVSDVTLFLIIVLGVANLIIIILASTPYLNNESNSLYYFNAIHRKGEQQFFADSTACCTEELELPDLRKQVGQLAKGLSDKFAALKIASMLFMIQFILFMILVFTIAFNIK